MRVSQANFSSTNWSGRRKLLVAGAVMFIALVLAFYDDVHVDPGTVLTFGYVAVFIIPMIASLTLLFPLPVFPIIFLAGSMLDPVTTGLLAAAGMTVGMAATYFVAASGQDAVQSSIANRSGIAGRLAQKIPGWSRAPVGPCVVLDVCDSGSAFFVLRSGSRRRGSPVADLLPLHVSWQNCSHAAVGIRRQVRRREGPIARLDHRVRP